MLEPQLRVVLVGLRRSQQHDHAFLSEPAPGLPDQPFPDALPLVLGIDRQIRQIGDVAEVRQGAGDADQAVAVPGGDGQAGVLQHAGEDVGPVDRPAFAQGRPPVEVDGSFDADGGVVAVVDVHGARGHGGMPESYPRRLNTPVPSPCPRTPGRRTPCSR